jgi:hypothetical protein
LLELLDGRLVHLLGDSVGVRERDGRRCHDCERRAESVG